MEKTNLFYFVFLSLEFSNFYVFLFLELFLHEPAMLLRYMHRFYLYGISLHVLEENTHTHTHTWMTMLQILMSFIFSSSNSTHFCFNLLPQTTYLFRMGLETIRKPWQCWNSTHYEIICKVFRKRCIIVWGCQIHLAIVICIFVIPWPRIG